MAERNAWILNFDAEYELEDPGGYQPPASTEARLRAQVQRLMGLVKPSDVVVWSTTPGLKQPLSGRCWCPTPRALARLSEIGAVLPAAPALTVLQRVNDRRFAHDLIEPWEGTCYVDGWESLQRIIEQPSPTGQWVAKRIFGFAGRGRRRLAWPLDVTGQAFCARAFAEGQGLMLEPWVQRTGDFVLHGLVEPAGEVQLGFPLQQVCSPAGVWQETRRGPEAMLSDPEHRALLDAGEIAGAALHAAGYFGPFGIDAFRYLDSRAQLRFRPLVEINARYTMGWALGMGLAP